MAKECDQPPNPDLVTCRNCEKQGHFARDCLEPKDWSKVQCQNCQEFGHTIKVSENCQNSVIGKLTSCSAARLLSLRATTWVEVLLLEATEAGEGEMTQQLLAAVRLPGTLVIALGKVSRFAALLPLFYDYRYGNSFNHDVERPKVYVRAVWFFKCQVFSSQRCSRLIARTQCLQMLKLALTNSDHSVPFPLMCNL